MAHARTPSTLSLLRLTRQVYQRLRAATPPFFRRLSWLMLSVSATAEALKLAAPSLATLGMPLSPTLLLHLDRAMAAGVLTGIISRLPVDWSRTRPSQVPDVEPPARDQN